VNSEALLARDTSNRERLKALERQDAKAAAAREAVAAEAARTGYPKRPTPFLASNQPGGGYGGGGDGGSTRGNGFRESSAGDSPPSFNIPTAALQSTLQSPLQSALQSPEKLGGGRPRASALPSYAASIGR
jgi:hypothetical protein